MNRRPLRFLIETGTFGLVYSWLKMFTGLDKTGKLLPRTRHWRMHLRTSVSCENSVASSLQWPMERLPECHVRGRRGLQEPCRTKRTTKPDLCRRRSSTTCRACASAPGRLLASGTCNTANSLKTDPLVYYLGWLIKIRGSTIWDRFSTRFSAV
jgi:hypothetical protein